MKRLFSSLFFVCVSGVLLAQSPDAAENGKKIFTARCAACHNFKQRLVGPSLKDVHLKCEEAWMVKFVQNSQAMIEAGDKDAVAIFNEFNQTVMPPHPDLTEENIKELIAYIKQESEKQAPAAKVASTSEETAIGGGETQADAASSYDFIPSFFYILFAVAVVALLVLLTFLVKINSQKK